MMKENGQGSSNLGHTFGHAIESFGNYDGTIIHEKQLIGICLAFKLSKKMVFVLKLKQQSNKFKKFETTNLFYGFKYFNNDFQNARKI